MAQHDYDIADQVGAAFRADINAALAAIVSNNSGASAPAETFAHQWWADTTAGILKRRDASDFAWINVMSLSAGLMIGTNVQAFDADTAKTDVAQTFTAPQRTQETTDNDGSFDCNINLDFECTPAAGFTLTFTNIPASPTVQRGSILLVNGANYAIAAHANTKVTSSLLTTISATGTYILAYETRNGLAYVTSAGAFA